MRDTFYVNCDSDGNMPVISHNAPIKEYWIYYVNNRPVKGKLYNGEEQVFDYAHGEFYAIQEGVKCWDGTAMKMIENFTVL
jgi:hypothetical protein